MLALAKKQLLPTEGGLVSWNTGTGLCKFELFSKVMKFQRSANMKTLRTFKVVLHIFKRYTVCAKTMWRDT